MVPYVIEQSSMHIQPVAGNAKFYILT